MMSSAPATIEPRASTSDRDGESAAARDPAGSRRRLDLDRAKGVGILLVVFGHLAAKSRPQDNEWFSYLQTDLYQFHMPFFMYLSGYVSYLSGSARVRPRGWPRLLSRRVARLLVPFFLFGPLLVTGKLFTAHFMSIDNAPASLGSALVGMLWDTDHSAAISIWYLAVVFMLAVITPPLLWLVRGRVGLLTLLAGAIYFVPVPHVMFLDKAAQFFVFFTLGGLASELGDRWLAFVDRYYREALIALTWLTFLMVYKYDSWPEWPRLLVCGIVSMPALHGMVRSDRFSSSAALVTLGSMSMVIYLLNTPFIGLAKGILQKFLPWDGSYFLVFLPVMFVAGILGPMLVKRLLFRRVRWLDQITN